MRWRRPHARRRLLAHPPDLKIKRASPKGDLRREQGTDEEQKRRVVGGTTGTGFGPTPTLFYLFCFVLAKGRKTSPLTRSVSLEGYHEDVPVPGLGGADVGVGRGRKVVAWELVSVTLLSPWTNRRNSQPPRHYNLVGVRGKATQFAAARWSASAGAESNSIHSPPLRSRSLASKEESGLCRIQSTSGNGGQQMSV